MDFYNEIKSELINNEINQKVKDYSKNKGELETYYKVGKLLVDAQGGEKRAKYGNKLIKQYSEKLIKELGDKKYSERNLMNMRKFYLKFYGEKVNALRTELSWSHYRELLLLEDYDEIDFYINLAITQNLGYRKLGERIKSKEYERLPESTKEKLIKEEKLDMIELVPNPILIPKNNIDVNNIKEKVLNKLIIEKSY